MLTEFTSGTPVHPNFGGFRAGRLSPASTSCFQASRDYIEHLIRFQIFKLVEEYGKDPFGFGGSDGHSFRIRFPRNLVVEFAQRHE